MVNPKLQISRERLADVCRRFGVRALSVFGSATRSDFRPDSDVDLLVEFDPENTPSLFRTVELKEELERLFGRQVDISTPEILRNPYRRATILRNLERLYVG